MAEQSAQEKSEAFLAELRKVLTPFMQPGIISLNPKFEEAKRAVEESNILTTFPDLAYLLDHSTMAEALLLAILSGNGKIYVKNDGVIGVSL
ncbi:MAG: hypothetical protein HZA34_03960 [Candidatus Pacebacteria bacterium]|nr:hypothetical protein [Candidatus Paceibacterota bacterium]